ncbi:MAG: hypothetical protein HQL42_13150 [Alphaproteobacteria bacterium]|nr:hypothetical protein [Alphaproteobacteria bacterium]
MPPLPLITKSAYAVHRGISAARVSQFVSEGSLDGALFHADGSPAGRKDRSALIHRDLADQALRTKISITAQVGQGKLPPPSQPAPPPATTEPLPPNPEDEAAAELLRLRLDKARRDDDRDRRRHAEETGLYTPTELAKSEFSRRLSAVASGVESWLPDLAAAIATALSSGQPPERRTILQVARSEYRRFRQGRADLAATDRDGQPRFISDPDEGGDTNPE